MDSLPLQEGEAETYKGFEKRTSESPTITYWYLINWEYEESITIGLW